MAAPISSLLELQSKSWVVELELELSAPRELTQSCGSDSAFRKGLHTNTHVYLQKNKCMRIKILGDCYYCVAGAPTPDTHHARNSISMGLNMIELIQSVR